jgi:hypothetical protein
MSGSPADAPAQTAHPDTGTPGIRAPGCST